MIETPRLIFEGWESFALEGDLLVPNDDPEVTRTLASIALKTYNDGILQPGGERNLVMKWSPFAATVTVEPISEGYVRLSTLHMHDKHPFSDKSNHTLDLTVKDKGQDGPRIHVAQTQITPRPSITYLLHTEELQQQARRQLKAAGNTFFEVLTYKL